MRCNKSLDFRKWRSQDSGMVEFNCEVCGRFVRKAWSKSMPGRPRFCSWECKSESQRRAKPVTREWLRQKYMTEGLDCVQIGKLVSRDPKSVWRWMRDFKIPTRKRGSMASARASAWVSSHSRYARSSEQNRQGTGESAIRSGGWAVYEKQARGTYSQLERRDNARAAGVLYYARMARSREGGVEARKCKMRAVRQ